MLQYHQSSPQRAQSIRLFQLIHQTNNSTIPTINAQAINNFLHHVGLQCKQDLVKFIHSIDKFNKQMRPQYWGYCISLALQNKNVMNERDLIQLHQHIKLLLMGSYVEPLKNFEKWDGNHQKNTLEKDQYLAKIINITQQLSGFINKIDFLTFSNAIQNINTCFSMITLFPEKKEQILYIFQNILGGSFLDTLQTALSMRLSQNLMIEALKSLCYIYQSLKYEKIAKILQNSFLLNLATLKGLTKSINDTRPEIRYYTCVMIALMVNNVKDLPTIKSFAHALITDKQLLYELSGGISKIREEEGLMFGIYFLIGIIRGFKHLNQTEKDEKISIISTYCKFVIDKLPQLKSQLNQAVCIQLITECIKYVDFNEQDIKMLKILNNVFESPSQQNFTPIFEATLDVVKYSLLFERKKIQDFILGDKSFEIYLKNLLKLNHQDYQPFYSGLQIVLILASQNSDILFKRDLIPSIFYLCQSKNGLVKFYLSQIILSIILNSLDEEWKITYLYEKECLKVIGNLIGEYFKRDLIMEGEYKTSLSLSYSNKQVFINALKCLHFLNLNSDSKKKQLYIKSFSQYFINNFSEGLLIYFNLFNNRQYLTFLLKEQHSLNQNLNQRQGPFIKLYKLMSNVVEQMTFCLRKKNTNLQILKLVNRTRSEFQTNLYSSLSYNQLIVENIPIYLVYSVNIDANVIKKRIYRLSWTQFRSLLQEFIKNCLFIETEHFKIIDKNSGIELRNDQDYRKLIDKILLDYKGFHFVVDISIENIREKIPEQRDRERDRDRDREAYGTSSMRIGQDYGRRDISRFNSYRMPQVRDNSPFNSRRGPDLSSERNPSPNFKVQCRMCKRPTINRTQICNNCCTTYQ